MDDNIKRKVVLKPVTDEEVKNIRAPYDVFVEIEDEPKGMTKQEAIELLTGIFGEEEANDPDILDFYMEVNKGVIEEYGRNQYNKALYDAVANAKAYDPIHSWNTPVIIEESILKLKKGIDE